MNLTDCIALAEFAHRNQFDKAGLPYIEHPKRVMKMVQEQGAAPYVQMAAILHDVTEDTPFTGEMLLTLGVPEAAVTLVLLLDRGYSKSVFEERMDNQRKVSAVWDTLDEDLQNHYLDTWIAEETIADDFYYGNIYRCPEAKMIKLADITDNTKPWRMSYLPEKTQQRLTTKYTLALLRLGVVASH